MALLFMDSFDHYVTADLLEKWTQSGASGSGASITIAAGGRRSSSSFRWVTGGTSTGSGFIQKTLGPADATCIMGFALTFTGNPAGSAGAAIAQIREGTSAQMTLRLNADSTLSVVRGEQNGTVLTGGTTVATLSAATYNYIEWKVVIHNSTGTVDIKINGASVLSITGQDTQNTANTSWNSVILGNFFQLTNSTSGTTRNVDYDDLYVLDGSGSAPWNTFLGDVRVDSRYPTAEGTTIGWTPLSGSDNALMVDETAPNDDTDYNSTSTVNAIDTFVTDNAPVSGASIFGVQHCISAKKSDAGVAFVAPVVRHSGADNVGTIAPLSTSYTYVTIAQQVNPGTSAQWTESDFNAAEFGYKRTS